MRGGRLFTDSGYNLQYRRFNANGSYRDLEERFVPGGCTEVDVAVNDVGSFVFAFTEEVTSPTFETSISRSTPTTEIESIAV